MKKRYKLMIFSFLAINIFSADLQNSTPSATTSIYKDITTEHWAYKSIENLYKKGIIDFNTEIFNGEKAINRFDMAYFLSKTLNRVENDKADRADLIVLEHIVYEFSEELTKFGFDTRTYLLKVDTFEAKLEENRLAAEGNKADIIKLDTRIQNIEKENSRKNQFLGQGDSFVDNKLAFLNDVNLYLKSNVDYKLSEKDDKNSFKGSHLLGLSFKRPSYELFLESETSDKERKKGELIVKGQINNEIIKGYTLNFHTADYERYFKSHFNNVIYDNHNSYRYTESEKEYQFDSFDSYGLALVNENLGFFLEKTRSDYDNVYTETNNIQGVTVDKAFSDTFNFIAKIDYKYFQALALKNINTDDTDIELTGKYPIKNFEFAASISQKKGKDRWLIGEFNNKEIDEAGEPLLTAYQTLNFLNAEIVSGKKNNFTLGLESKFNENHKLYTAYYGSYKYNLTDNGKIKYKYEYINRDSAQSRDDYSNQYIVINLFGEKLNTYGSYSMVNLNKRFYYVEGEIYEKEKNYTETLLKSTYKFSDKALAKIGYLLREYKDNKFEKREISFVQGQFNLNESTNFFAKYIKNTGEDFSDRKLDVDNNMIDLDFDGKTGVIRKAPEGRIEVGIEIVF